ncbi:hypothetical protein [Corynebacterium sp. TAE3-ERU16]|uniref:hypothetical protein n=1 Tax=Corynebacterium sp. TAE3-ERU16 TaxID=2849493 RepID=UPI001C45A829|nr:hypothetical protein [Corynebacterium sp. TAE3-ERU16]MBV7293449.1 hypothetical protein [Corynebacterium sp. TAE3-ERU16]
MATVAYSGVSTPAGFKHSARVLGVVLVLGAWQMLLFTGSTPEKRRAINVDDTWYRYPVDDVHITAGIPQVVFCAVFCLVTWLAATGFSIVKNRFVAPAVVAGFWIGLFVVPFILRQQKGESLGGPFDGLVAGILWLVLLGVTSGWLLSWWLTMLNVAESALVFAPVAGCAFACSPGLAASGTNSLFAIGAGLCAMLGVGARHSARYPVLVGPVACVGLWMMWPETVLAGAPEYTARAVLTAAFVPIVCEAVYRRELVLPRGSSPQVGDGTHVPLDRAELDWLSPPPNASRRDPTNGLDPREAESRHAKERGLATGLAAYWWTVIALAAVTVAVPAILMRTLFVRENEFIGVAPTPDGVPFWSGTLFPMGMHQSIAGGITVGAPMSDNSDWFFIDPAAQDPLTVVCVLGGLTGLAVMMRKLKLMNFLMAAYSVTVAGGAYIGYATIEGMESDFRVELTLVASLVMGLLVVILPAAASVVSRSSAAHTESYAPSKSLVAFVVCLAAVLVAGSSSWLRAGVFDPVLTASDKPTDLILGQMFTPNLALVTTVVALTVAASLGCWWLLGSMRWQWCVLVAVAGLLALQTAGLFASGVPGCAVVGAGVAAWVGGVMNVIKIPRQIPGDLVSRTARAL